MPKCNRCGTELERIRYIEPDWSGGPTDTGSRPPLCEPCWKRADAEARTRQQGGDQ